jgi:hypothetical protein
MVEEQGGDEFTAFLHLIEWDDDEVGEVDEEVKEACGGQRSERNRFQCPNWILDFVEDVVGVAKTGIRI